MSKALICKVIICNVDCGVFGKLVGLFVFMRGYGASDGTKRGFGGGGGRTSPPKLDFMGGYLL